MEPLPTNLRGGAKTAAIGGLLARDLITKFQYPDHAEYYLTAAAYEAVGRKRVVPAPVTPDAENDIFGFADDVVAFSGSIAGGDRKLYVYDSLAVRGGSPGLTVIMAAPTVSGGAALTSFASGIWTGFGEAVELADLSAFSADGSAFVTGPADLGIALAFSLTGTEASVSVTYDTSLTVPPEAGVPEPATLMLIAAGLLGFGATRKRRC